MTTPVPVSKTPLPPTTLFKHGDYEVLSELVNPGELSVDPYPKAGAAPPAVPYQPGSKKKFEDHAFDRLYHHRGDLGIQSLSRCRGARTDGILRLCQAGSNVVLLEIKTMLSWSSLNTAMGQFISATKLLRKTEQIAGATQGLVVFETFSSDWVRGHEDSLRPWALLYRHLEEMEAGFHMSALQLWEDEFYNPFLNDAPIPGKIGRLFRPYLCQGHTGKPMAPPSHFPK